MTPADETDRLAEVVWPNSLGFQPARPCAGLLKNELRRLGSLIIACADRTAVPAGAVLAVGREGFSQAVTEAIVSHPRIVLSARRGVGNPGERADGDRHRTAYFRTAG